MTKGFLMVSQHSPALDVNLGNGIIDRVIDAAENARLTVPPAIKAMHSGGDKNHPNPWYQALALGVGGIEEREQAVIQLAQVAEWARGLRESRSVSMSIDLNRGEQKRQAAVKLPAADKLKQVMSLDDALHLGVIAQIYQEPMVAQKALRKALREETSIAAVVSALETAPEQYGQLVGDRVDGHDLPARQMAMTTLQEQLIAPLSAVSQAEDQLQATLPAAMKPRAGVNHKLLAFDDAARRLILTQKALMASDIRDEMAHEKELSQGVHRGPYHVHTRPKTRKM